MVCASDGDDPKGLNQTPLRTMTFTFATRPVMEHKAIRDKQSSQLSMNEDKLIGISSEQIGALAEISATASELDGLVSQGMTIAQEALGQLERRGADELSEGITGEIINHREGLNVDGHAGMQRSVNILEQRVNNIRSNPNGGDNRNNTNGGDTLGSQRLSASESQAAFVNP